MFRKIPIKSLLDSTLLYHHDSKNIKSQNYHRFYNFQPPFSIKDTRKPLHHILNHWRKRKILFHQKYRLANRCSTFRCSLTLRRVRCYAIQIHDENANSSRVHREKRGACSRRAHVYRRKLTHEQHDGSSLLGKPGVPLRFFFSSHPLDIRHLSCRWHPSRSAGYQTWTNRRQGTEAQTSENVCCRLARCHIVSCTVDTELPNRINYSDFDDCNHHRSGNYSKDGKKYAVTDKKVLNTHILES